MIDRNVWWDLNDPVSTRHGGGRGVGFAVAERLSRAGAIVVIADEPAGTAAAERIGADGWSATSRRR